MATLAHNLASRRSSVQERYPGMTVFWEGDPVHQATESDHNPDSRGVVHAIDCMTYADKAKGREIVNWMLVQPDDLEYVIFDHQIWTRSNKFKPVPYTGDNPHEDHVHGSGKHGSTGYSPATGTGYDTAAEQMTPKGMDTVSKQEVLDAFTTAVPWTSSGVRDFAKAHGWGDTVSERALIEYIWEKTYYGVDELKAEIAKANQKLDQLIAGGVPPADLSVIKIELDEIKKIVTGLADGVRANAAALAVTGE